MIPAITEVNFPSYATLHQATVSLQDMGDRVITTQVRIDGDIVPDFSGWELRFKGERFVLPSDNPQASKDNTTRNSIIDLQFQSWAIQELKRYYFFEAASVSAGVAIADKYIAPVRLNVEDFVALLNQVLQYYFGGKIVADLYLSGTGIYSQEPKVIDINYSYLWDVIGKIFEIYGVRNRIEYNATSDVYTIKINYPAPEISDHDFEYGYQGGLLKFERQVQDESLSNILLGRGGEKNLPYRYFKKVDPQNPEWAADPDAIPELANIYFDRLRDINLRWYVRGWMHNPNRDTSGDEAWDPGHVFPTYEISSDSPHYWAYQKGLTDEAFSPVEYVKDDASIAAYGEHWGALDDNDDVYPTIQGRSRAGVGRIDEVVAVSPIVTDDIDAMSKAAALEKSINPLLVSYPRSNNDSPILSENFEIPSGQTGNITYAWVGPTDGTGIHIDTTQSTIVAVDSAGNEHSISGLSAGTYRLKLVISLYVPSGATASGTFGIENIKLTLSTQDADAWKPTFDIWVKDIWGTSRRQGETDEQYSERVWGPILGDRAGNEAKVAFSTGFMASSSDYEFVIASYPVPDTSKSIGGVQSAWRITLRKSDAEFDATGLYIPNATTGGKPVAGDKFFFTGIDMPHAYVEMGEEELSTVKSGELQGTATVNPTWIISLDKVRVNTLEAGEYGQTLADRLAAGAKLRVTDPRFSGGDVLILHAQSITYTWNEPTDDNPYIVPDIEVVLSDKVVSRESRQDKIESSVEQIRAQYARLDDVEAVVRKVSEPLFLKKTGESDSSASPTQFSSKVSSKGFRQGGVGGTGWGFYRDNTAEFADGEIGEGDTVLEVDRMIVRKEMQVNSLVVNQVEYRGGMEVISAAKIEISKVVETPTRYVCYFDQRKNSVANNFQVGDIAYGQVFTPQNATLRYYKCKVEAVDVDRVELSKTIKDGSGVPQAGDIIVQYGSYTDAARQYVIVRDVIGGGYERMISGLNAVDASGAEYYFAGRQSGNGPRWFVGGHGANDDYAEFVNGVLTIKANVVFKPGQQIPGLEDYEYLKTALPLDEDATLVSGGLILSKTIALTDAQGNIKAGINGLTTLGNIAAWYGGPMVDREAVPLASDYAKTIFRFDGSGYLAGGNIHWGSDGYGGIPGITWSREGGQDVVTIGGNVRLESVDDDTVTNIVTAVQQLPNTYVNFVSAQTISGLKTFTPGVKFGSGATANPNADLEVVTMNIGGTNKRVLHTKLPIVSDDFMSAFGASATPGASGIDADAMWQLLGASTAEQIAASHLQTAFATLNLGAAATYGIGQVASGNNGLVTGGAVWAAIDAMPEPMIFKGSLGTGGTITSLPAASAANDGFVYKVITDGTYRGQAAEVGDLFISNGSAWIWIPSGDEPSGTVTSVGVSVPTGFSVSNTPVTSSGTIAITFASGYSLPKTSKQKNWDTAYGWGNHATAGYLLASTAASTYQPLDADLTAISGLSGTSGVLKKTAANTWALDTNIETYAGNGNTAYGYFSNGVLPSGKGGTGFDSYTKGNIIYASATDTLAKLSPNSTATKKYLTMTSSVPSWGSITFGDLPTLYIGNAAVQNVAQTAQNIGGLGVLTLANGKAIDFLNNPAEGETAVAWSVLQLASTNKLFVGFDSSAGGAETYLYGSTIYFRYGTGHNNGLILDSTALTSYRDIIPASNGTRNLGSASAMWKYTYTNRLYLNANTYFTVDSDGNVHLVQPSGKGFWADGFMSAFGLSSTSGGGGLDPEVMWAYLRNTATDTTYNNAKIHTAHLPALTANNGLTASYSGTPDNTALTIGVGSGYKLPTTTEWGNKQDKYDFTITGTSGSTYNLANFVTSAVTNVAVGTGDNSDKLAVTKDGTTSYLTVPYATNVKRFKRYTGTAAAGGYDLNTLLSGGGITSQYNSGGYWANRPDTMSFGGVLQINPQTNDTLSMQLAWDVKQTGQTSGNTGKLWWRDRYVLNSVGYWGDWHIIYDSTSLLLNGAAGDDTALTFYAPTTAGTSGQLLKSGGANTAPAWTSSALGSATKHVYLNDSGVLTEGSAYAGGTKVTLNGADKGATTAAFFAPTGAGNAGQVLLSGGAGVAPAWSSAALGAANKPVYINASGVLTEGSACVTLAGAQTITGAKTLSANLTLNNAVGLYCKDANDNSVEALCMSSSDLLRIGYGNRLAGTTGIYGKTFRIGTTDTAAGPDIYIGGLSTTHNIDAANIYFHSLITSTGIRNGLKVSAEHVASADRLNLSVYTSNNSTSPYAPSWNKTLEVTYTGKVNVGAPSNTTATVNVAGTIWASTGIWSDGYMSAYGLASSSDARLKDNIKDFAYTPELLMSLKPREWDWNGKANINGHAAGFVAQEVEPHLPYAVTERVYKQLFYDTFHAIEMSGLQDHERRIKALEAENRKKDAKIEELEEEIKRLRAI